ncbi:DUF4062 domain-containing protein [Xanthomonas rydalmerensis]|uniref:DUF4062 domain-containing protein n=1 Tax=Xanthomonas rydalmerensis TaxID=3046274 RepID=A0ABZ0JMT6_9XANT|nr:DUF4062 domain-containing protein [Xanthomonas sp. DM-2023]WOS40955.1 DUF4062 domain-containing protein [Xanthomonas sp. DM-2023]WOS45140.1 DUF4062 domain-containing protein [Xanthomonas sp. DM-2023]WOS49319.1 DUF4062 domain-containing protein [Xanthomonas sp. DM-2023]WOS53499.1 DUF4062 domain-containing protein [Xanthomonas sp. DM-2023]WOS57682.1 DUF4062 domain-containing protein [Xanthomonas sp. DM-2023]
MDKRYQVFLSSTYADLKDERQHVIQTLMEMDCIPAGMELFPATDEEQFDFIKRVINDCDYYLLIIGGRYGSTTREGISYTEKEYDYAVSLGLKVIAFLHQNPDEIAVGKTDKDPGLTARLQEFRAKVEVGRLVKYWRMASDLPGLVALSLSKTIKTYPAVGWVRANQVGSNQLLTELNGVRRENEELRAALTEARVNTQQRLANLATLTDSFSVHGQLKVARDYAWRNWEYLLTWGEIFALIAPYLLEHPNDTSVMLTLKKAILEHKDQEYYECKINDHDFQTIKVQLKALGHVQVSYMKTTRGGMALFWALTPQGEATMLELRAVRQAS